MPRRNSGMRGPHGPGAMGAVEKPKNFKKSFKELMAYIGRYKIGVFAVMILAAGSTVFNVVGPKIMGHATTELASGLMRKVAGTGGINFDKIAHILILTLALYLISAGLNFIQGWIMTGITQKVVYRMRKEIAEKINRMPMKYFESRPIGEVLSRITNDVDTLGTGLNQSITMIISAVATIVGVIVMMLTISPLMTLIALVMIPLSALLMGIVIKMSQKYFKQQQASLGVINGQVEENFSGQQVVKAFNREKQTIAEFSKTNDELFTSAWKSQFLSGAMMPLMNFVGYLAYAGVAIAGGMLAIRNVIGIGDIQAFIQYVRNLTQPMAQISQVMNQVQSMTAASERVFQLLNEEETDLQKDSPLPLKEVKGEVEFDHVAFGYDPDQMIIHDF